MDVIVNDTLDSDADAKQKCLEVCQLVGAKWNNQWTNAKGSPYTCGCSVGGSEANVCTKKDTPVSADNAQSVCTETCGFFGSNWNNKYNEGRDPARITQASVCGCKASSTNESSTAGSQPASGNTETGNESLI